MLRQLRALYTSFLLAGLLLLAACTSLSTGGYMPSSFSGAVLPQQPQKIALLLPMQGQWSGAANAVRNGFFSAYYADSSSSKAPSVNVYDTTQGNIASVYAKAVQDGADVVVGPLTKENVQALAQSGDLKVPTIALNNIDNPNFHSPRNFFQYGLSPVDEATQAAQKAHNDGRKNIIVIAPQDAWGQSVKQAFIQQWQSQGGTVVTTLDYSPQTNLTKAVGQLLQFSQSKQPDPKRPGRQLVQTHVRQDFDSVFLVSSPTTARLIKPLLLFYYTGSTPVYSISSVYSGQPAPNRDKDLDGILFCDMPWVLESNGTIDAAKANAAKLWPNSFYQYTKLYAMGMDAYAIVNNLNGLSSSTNHTVPGMTGVLWMDNNHVIHRQLDWAQFQNGLPQLTSTAH